MNVDLKAYTSPRKKKTQGKQKIKSGNGSGYLDLVDKMQKRGAGSWWRMVHRKGEINNRALVIFSKIQKFCR